MKIKIGMIFGGNDQASIDKSISLVEHIDKNKYGVFDNIDGRKICNSLFLDGNVLNKDFLKYL